jgi:serine/threonine protein phosphatase PrpC
MRIAHRSDLGYVRTRNEDAVLVLELAAQRCLVGVADGMGGHPAGDVASKIAVETLASSLAGQLSGATPTTDETLAGGLAAALQAAHAAVLAAAAAEPAYEGMGTTAAIAYVDGERATIAHVGDSRIYHVHDGVADQVTHDHNRGGYLTQALGVPYPITPDTSELALAPGHRLLLCTDGLSGLVSPTAIGALASTPDPNGACDRLVESALSAGGYDNVTVVLVAV